jgi:hypothetical protein
VRAQAFDVVRRQLDALFQGQFDDRFEPDRTVQVPVQIDQRQVGVDVSLFVHGCALNRRNVIFAGLSALSSKAVKAALKLTGFFGTMTPSQRWKSRS